MREMESDILEKIWHDFRAPKGNLVSTKYVGLESPAKIQLRPVYFWFDLLMVIERYADLKSIFDR